MTSVNLHLHLLCWDQVKAGRQENFYMTKGSQKAIFMLHTFLEVGGDLIICKAMPFPNCKLTYHKKAQPIRTIYKLLPEPIYFTSLLSSALSLSHPLSLLSPRKHV